jgi:hypothetical protein
MNERKTEGKEGGKRRRKEGKERERKKEKEKLNWF